MQKEHLLLGGTRIFAASSFRIGDRDDKATFEESHLPPLQAHKSGPALHVRHASTIGHCMSLKKLFWGLVSGARVKALKNEPRSLMGNFVAGTSYNLLKSDAKVPKTFSETHSRHTIPFTEPAHHLLASQTYFRLHPRPSCRFGFLKYDIDNLRPIPDPIPIKSKLCTVFF